MTKVSGVTRACFIRRKRFRSGMRTRFLLLAPVCSLLAPMAVAALPPSQPSYGDRMIAEYFRLETAKVTERCLTDIKTLDDWTSQRENFRQQLFEMLGLWPMPPNADLKPVITGQVEHESFTVEKLQFQSMPGLYVTANLYLPKHLPKPSPAVLYVC